MWLSFHGGSVEVVPKLDGLFLGSRLYYGGANSRVGRGPICRQIGVGFGANPSGNLLVGMKGEEREDI